jgi:hypothetical protein
MISLTTNSLTTLLNGTDASNAALLSVVDGASKYLDPSNANFLLTQLNESILDAGDFTGVQGAIDTYTQSLPSSNVYESAYTAPSSAFLSDLKSLEGDANAGDLGAAESDLAQAKLDAPDSLPDAAGLAVAKGDTEGLAGLVVEGESNISDYLLSLGYATVDANTEADAITINGLVGPANGTQQASQARLNQVVDLAAGIASKTVAEAHGAATAASEPLFNVVETLLEGSSSASSVNLARLDSFYGTDSSEASSARPQALDSYA